MRQIVNILFLGGAKRVEMARQFRKAGEALGLEVVLFSYELSREVPLACEASIIEGLRFKDADVLGDIHRVVEENRMDVLVPFVDPAVEVASAYCGSDSRCFAPCSDAALSRRLFDKVESDALFRSLGFRLPPEAAEAERVICKPRFGSASKGIRVVDRSEYLRLLSSPECGDYLYQGYVPHREEYSVDCYVNRLGEFVCAVPRKRLEVSGGEVTSTVTVNSPELISESREILKGLGIRGAATLQFLRSTEGEHQPYCLMEVNPRLGGGAVCSVYAGASLPEFILRDWMGKPAGMCASWREGIKICRYPADVVFSPSGEVIAGEE